MHSVDYWIKHLNMTAHPEGGYYAETYKSADILSQQGLPSRFTGSRAASTAIYFLLKSGEVSHLHRLKSDEIWHFYSGAPLSVHVIDDFGLYQTLQLGSEPMKGQSFQHCVPAGCWFGASVDEPDSHTLVGATVAPGFEFEDFELAERSEMITRFPEHEDIIERLT